MPVIRFSPPRRLMIRFTAFEVVIEGRGLDILEEQLSKEVVTWIRENDSGIDVPDHDVFIERIQVTEY